jgi:hypothetical protein
MILSSYYYPGRLAIGTVSFKIYLEEACRIMYSSSSRMLSVP